MVLAQLGHLDGIRHRQHAGQFAAIWGGNTGFWEALAYWTRTIAITLVIPDLALPVAGLIAIAAVYRWRAGGKTNQPSPDVLGLAGLLQVVTVLTALLFSHNHQPRFILPLLPAAAALLVCWSVGSLARVWPSPCLRCSAAGCGDTASSCSRRILGPTLARSTGRARKPPCSTRWWPARVGTRRPVVTVGMIAIDPAFRGDWLAPEPANYVATREAYARAGRPACEFGFLGGGSFGDRAGRAWDDMVASNVRYVVTVDPSAYPVRAKTYNRALDGTHFPVCGPPSSEVPCNAEPRLPQHRSLAILRRVDPQ